MELWNDEVKLSRREQKALHADTRSISAMRIGHVWRAAVEANTERLQQEHSEPSKSYVVTGPFGMVSTYNPGHVSIRSLEQNRHILSAMETNVLGIERDTLPIESDQQQEL